MGSYLTRRCFGILINVFLVTVFFFALLRLLPGDLTLTILTRASTAEQREAFRAEHGLDHGAVEQYLNWLASALTGDFGTSFRTGFSVASEFLLRLPVTMEIVVLSFTFTTIFGIGGGVLAAVRQDTYWDYVIRVVAVLGISVPTFLTLTLLLIFPARWFSYAPPFGATDFLDNPVDNLRLFIPPTLLLAIGASSGLIRLTRTAMLDVLRQDYIRTARGKGLPERTVISRHAVKNALPTIVTLVGIQFSFLLAGSIILEHIMALPGLGTWVLGAIQSKDYPIVLMFSLYASVTLMLITLLVDLLYAVMDPRIRYE